METYWLNVTFVNHANLNLNKKGKKNDKTMPKERFVFSSNLHKSTLDFRVARAYFIRRSSAEVFCKKRVLKNFANFLGKRLCWNFVLLKLQALQALQLC